jgi:hypothetical protein
MSDRTQPTNLTISKHAAPTNASAAKVNAGSSHSGHTFTVWADRTVWCVTDSVAISNPENHFARFHELFQG